jgi:hypothetical protein
MIKKLMEYFSPWKRLAELSAENARLSELLTGKVLDIKVDNGVNFTIQTKLASIMADSFDSLFKGDNSAKNYVEYTFNGNDSQILVTVQRKLGKTPHQLRAEAEYELKRYKERFGEL